MESDPVPEHFNKGYIEARALYYDDRLGEASEAAQQLLEDPGITQASTRGTSLTDSRYLFPVSSHQMLHDCHGMHG